MRSALLALSCVATAVFHATALAQVATGLSLETDLIIVNRMPGPVAPTPLPRSIGATFFVANDTAHDIAFELVSHCQENEHAQFTLKNAAGTVLWKFIRTDLGCPDFLQHGVLGASQRYSRTVDVPLFIDGVFLPDGNYTVEAEADGTPRYGAFAPFSVITAF